MQTATATNLNPTQVAPANNSNNRRSFQVLAGYYPTEGNEWFVALPCESALQRTVVVRANGRTAMAQVLDVGPWNGDDEYWTGTGRPQAECGIDKTGRETDRTGIELSDALYRHLGLSEGQQVEWRFVDPAEQTERPALQAQPSQPAMIRADDPRWLRFGAAGDQVRDIQYRLQKKGYSILLTGHFNVVTESVVKAFQRRCGLLPTGVINPETWQALAC